MELAGYFAIARRWWLLVLISIILAAVAGSMVASRLPKVYEAEVRVLVGPVNTDLQTQRASGQLADTYAQLVTSDRITSAVVQRLAPRMTSSDLQDAITAVPNDVTRLIAIRVQNGDPNTAATLADGVANELATLGASVNRPEGKVTMVDPAEVPAAPIAPQVSLIVLLAAFAGLVVAISIIVLIEYLRDALTSEDDLRELSGAPILGRLATRFGGKRDFASDVLGSKLGDGYRAMTARIERSIGEGKVRTLLVTGLREDGTAGIVAAGLALAFADRGIRTAIVDANLSRADATHALNLETLTEVRNDVGSRIPVSRLTLVAGEDAPGDWRNVEVTVVPSGTGHLGKAQDLGKILDGLRATAEVVVVAAPTIGSPEALLWASVVDAVVMALPLPGTRRREVSSGLEALRLAGLHLVGTILVEPRKGRLRLRGRGAQKAVTAFQHRVVRDVLVTGAPRRVPAQRRRTSAQAQR